jgi:uncharacterized protein with HEPN domain
MKKDIHPYLEDILDYIEKLERFAKVGREVYLTDDMVRLAIERCYIVLGEVIKRLPSELLEQYPHVDWKNIARYRDILIHHYERINPNIGWDALQYLPDLKTAVEDMLAHLDSETGPE